MAIVVQCFQCSTILELDDGFRGGVARCSNCGALLRVPKEVGTAGASSRPHTPSTPQPRPKAASDPGVSSGGMRGSGLQRRAGDPTVSSGAFSRSGRPQTPPPSSPVIRHSHTGSGISSHPSRHTQDQNAPSKQFSGPLILGIFLAAIIFTIACIAVWQLFGSHGSQQSGPGISSYDQGGSSIPNPQPQPMDNVPQGPPQINGSIPNGWAAYDIGGPLKPSTISYDQSSDAWTITGIGRDVYGDRDQFSFVCKNWTGNGQISAEMMSISDVYSWAKAGVMFRASTDRGAPYVDVFATPEEGVAMQLRTEQDGVSTNTQVPNITMPVYVMVKRQGNNFTGYYSKDGITWSTITSAVVNMNDPICAGMMVVAHNKTTSCIATFGKVSVEPLSSN